MGPLVLVWILMDDLCNGSDLLLLKYFGYFESLATQIARYTNLSIRTLSPTLLAAGVGVGDTPLQKVHSTVSVSTSREKFGARYNIISITIGKASLGPISALGIAWVGIWCAWIGCGISSFDSCQKLYSVSEI